MSTANKPQPDNGNRYRIEAVWQAGQILKAVAHSKEPLGSTELAKLCGISANIAFRTCVTLEELGFLRQVGDKYEPGMAMALFWARKKALLEGERERIGKDLESIHITEDDHGK